MRATKVEEMLRHSLDVSLKQTRAAALQGTFGASISPERQKEKVFALLSSNLSWDKLKPSFLKLYADAFTDDELDGLLAFYRSPAGQAMISKTPALMTKANQVVQQAMSQVAPELQKLIAESAKKAEAPRQ